MAEIWGALAIAAVGAGTAIYGANQQKKANAAANATNAENVDKTNDSAWASYLLARGVNPAGAKAGVLPSNPQAVNTRLPLWAQVSRPGTASKGFRITGGPNSGPKLSTAGTGFSQPAAAIDPNTAAAGSGSSGGSSKVNDILIGNPLGIGGKDRSWYDPLGIF